MKLTAAQAREREKREEEFRKERERIAMQRALFAALPSDPAVTAFKNAMLDRAWRLIDEARPEEADAIMEFLPASDAEQLLNEYFDEEYENPSCSPKAAAGQNEDNQPR